MSQQWRSSNIRPCLSEITTLPTKIGTIVTETIGNKNHEPEEQQNNLLEQYSQE